MAILEINDVLAKINNQERFEGTLADGSLFIKITEYVPYICTAIHHGHQFRNELINICNLSENDRYHEEDPYTGDMIRFAPIQLIALDSRYEYDLNRGPNECLYDNAWGVQVFKRSLTDTEKQTSLNKHAQFYKICHALIEQLLNNIASTCVIFDIHSYNITDRNYVAPPMFNLGTHFVNKNKFGKFTDAWVEALSKIKLPDIEVVAKENDVFFGKGYLAESASKLYPNCLVLPTEVKKIYADEFEPKPNQPIIKAIASGFESAIFEIFKNNSVS